MSASSNRWDVIIAGCGPVGAYAANLCGKAGLRTLVLEKDQSPYALPRAVHLDHEMIRLLADIGLKENLLPKMREGDGHIHIGADQGVIRFLSAADQPKPFGYANDYFFYQPELEAELREGLNRFEHVELRLSEKVVGLAQTEKGVEISLETGERLKSDWLIGCDGARSSVRNLLQVELDDLKFEEPWLVVDAEVQDSIAFPDFSHVPDGADLQNLSLMMCDPQRPATIVPGRGNHRRWEFMVLPNEDDKEVANAENVEKLVTPWLGAGSHQIIRAATYRFHGLIAKQWQVGRAFLCGDAAHQTPPFFGQGMCHGLRDAANLIWKLALVCKCAADASMLKTYQIERDEHVRFVIGKAVEAGRYICELDPESARRRDEQFRSEQDMSSASELIPPISGSLIGESAGERFINPQFNEGTFLDDLTNGGWVLICPQDWSLSLQAEITLNSLDANKFDLFENLDDPASHVTNWFAVRRTKAALIRPDFYVALLANDPESLSDQLANLSENLALFSHAQNPTTNADNGEPYAIH